MTNFKTTNMYRFNIANILKLLKRYRYIVIAIITALSIALLSISIISTHVSAKKVSDRVKVVKSVKIEKGDTLWGIAKEYITEEYDSIQTYINEIKRSNGLLSDMIHEDSYIIVPYYTAKR